MYLKILSVAAVTTTEAERSIGVLVRHSAFATLLAASALATNTSCVVYAITRASNSPLQPKTR